MSAEEKVMGEPVEQAEKKIEKRAGAEVEAEAERYTCPECGTGLEKVETPTGIAYRCPKCGRFRPPGGEREKAPEEEKAIKPPEIEAQERALRLLRDRLPSVYGLTKERVRAVVETLEQNPEILANPQGLFYHIQAMAGKNLNQYQLNLVLSGVLRESGLYPSPPVAPPFGFAQPQPQYPYWQVQYPQFGAAPSAPHQWPGWQRPAAPPKPPKTYKVVVDKQEIETDEKGYMAWLKFLDERREREQVGAKEEPMAEVPTAEGKIVKVPASHAIYHVQTQLLQRQLEEARRPEAKVNIPTGEGKTAEVPVSQAPYLMQAQWAQAEREQAEREAERVRGAYDGLSKQLTPKAMAERAKTMGYVQAGSPAYALVSTAKRDFEEKADRLFNLLERQVPRTPTGPVYTHEERERKAEEVTERIKKAEGMVESEEALIRAAHALAEEDRRKKIEEPERPKAAHKG